MKPKLILAALVVSAGIIGGCTFEKAFVRPVSTNHVAVVTGAATTNDAEVVADLKLAREVNRVANVTPTRDIADAVIGAAISIAAAVGGWYARNHSGAVTTQRVMEIMAAMEAAKANKLPGKN